MKPRPMPHWYARLTWRRAERTSFGGRYHSPKRVPMVNRFDWLVVVKNWRAVQSRPVRWPMQPGPGRLIRRWMKGTWR